MRIGILNGGGDAQGLNGVIESFTKYATSQNAEVIGFLRGWEGVLDLNYIELTSERVDGIGEKGGTILYTTSRGRFAGKRDHGEINIIEKEILELAKQNLLSLGIDVLVVIGGDGTLAGAKQLSDIGIKIVGIPKTIDNDLNYTEKTFGFSSAVQVLSDAIDNIKTTAKSHNRVFLVEAMGRHSGWIGLYGGVSGGADGILIPEVSFSIDNLVSNITRIHSEKGFCIVVVSEGIDLTNRKNKIQDTSEKRLAGVCDTLAEVIRSEVGDKFEIRTLIVGHLQRGGSPNSDDRILSKMYGVEAFEMIKREEFGRMLALRDGKIVSVEINLGTSVLKKVGREDLILNLARKTGIFFGDI